MTYAEIILALDVRNCVSTITALNFAVREEGCELLDRGSSWGGYKNALMQRQRVPSKRAEEAAQAFYAEDITKLLNNPVQPSPHRLLSLRRFAVAWAVAEVLRTNDDITKCGTKTL